MIEFEVVALMRSIGELVKIDLGIPQVLLSDYYEDFLKGDF